jgi:predicted acylesterase/phospholipase RssA
MQSELIMVINNGNKSFDNGDKKNSIAKPKTTRQINEKVKSTVFEQLGKKNQDKKIENVLILQGGGSLGAFAFGVFKAISTNHIKLDIVAGTSIGGVNAAIIAGSKNEEHPEQELEKFWLELSDSFVDLDKTVWPFPSIQKNMKQSLASGY